MTRSIHRIGIALVLGVSAILVTTRAGQTQSPVLGPTQGATRVIGNDQWDIFYLERGDGSYDPATNYNYLVAKQDIGDSQLTQTQRKGLFNRFVQGLGWKDTDFASISVKTDSVPELAILAVQKDASDSLLSPNADEWRISGLKSYLPGNAVGLTISLKGGNRIDSTIVQNALAATKVIAGALGGGPAVKTLSAIPASVTVALDTFAGKLAGGTSQAAPALSIDGVKLKRQPVYEFLFFDKPKTDSSRKAVAKVTITAKSQTSLFGDLAPNPGPAFFNTLLHAPLDGKTEQDGGVSMYKGLQGNPLFTSFASERYDQYYTLCDQLPGYLAGLGLVPHDVTLAHYAFLSAAKGGGAARTGGLPVCPGEASVSEMRRLNLAPLPAELLDANLATQRAQLRMQQETLFRKIATALAQAQSQGIQDLCQGTVMLWQSVKVFADAPTTKDVARGNDEIGDLFVGLARGMPNGVKIGGFDYSGQGQLSGHAILRVVRSATDVDRYRITIVLNSDNLIQRIAIDPADS